MSILFLVLRILGVVLLAVLALAAVAMLLPAGYPLAPRRPAGGLADGRPAAAEVFPVSGRNAARRQKKRRKSAGCSTPRGPKSA